MPTYEELKAELLEISKIIEKFPEQVKKQVYALLVQEFLGIPIPKSTSPAENDAISKIAEAPPEQKKGRKPSSKESYVIDRNLNLRGDKSIPSFKEFCHQKNPGSAKEFNAVSIYYLKKLMNLDEVTLNHAYTCYAEVSRKPPQAFRQSFIDTKNKEGWVEFNADGNLEIPHRGVVFVEYDLPKQPKRNKANESKKILSGISAC